MMWLLVHLFYLIGFQNRLLVLLRWTISFVTRGRGARLIVEHPTAQITRPRRGEGPSDTAGACPVARSSDATG